MSAGTQPDWYIGFADGALRLAPGLESEILGLTISWNILVPMAVLGLFIVLVMFYPFIEQWITGDKREHHLAERPRNNPTRTAIGVAGIVFYAVMWAAGPNGVEGIEWAFVLLAFLADLSSWAGGAGHRSRRD